MFKQLFGLTPTGSFIETAMVLSTTWIFKDIDVLPKNINNPTIIDIGAHIGITARYFKKLFPNSTVICYEPNPDTFLLLKKNTQKLKKINLINSAVHDFTGKTQLTVTGRAWSDSLFKQDKGKKININVVSASDICHQHVDLLKIDAEGSEYAIIRDLNQSGTIANVDRIVMEYHGKINNANRLKEILTIYDKWGFNYTIGVYLRILKISPKIIFKLHPRLLDFLIINAWKKNLNQVN